MGTTSRHQPHGNRILGLSCAATIAVITLLSACAAPTPSPIVTHHPPAHATGQSQPQPATPPQLLGGDCTGLASLSVIQAGVGSTAVAAAPAESSGEPPTGSLEWIAARQAGALFCGWADPTEAHNLNVQIIPNASAAFTADTTALNAASDATGAHHVSGVPTYGDASWSQCEGETESPDGTCEFDIKVGSYWLSVNEQNTAHLQPYPESAAEKTMLNDLVNSARALPAFRVWAPSTRTPSLPTTCDGALPLATVRTATGNGSEAASPDGFTIDDVPWILTHSLSCTWSSPTGVDLFFTIVPGSAWGDAPTPTVSGTTTQPGLGAQASGGCVSSDGQDACDLLVRSGNTWFELTDNGTGSSMTLAPLRSLAHSVLTLIG
ncbi:MAG TPA: hypothetical protein VHZ81_05950 [Galbitalea sp.]|nr:hypothetical protein [Galbitalea sp.]